MLTLLAPVLSGVPSFLLLLVQVHTSWIFHGMYPKELFTAFHEQNRILRPGGYMWWVGGWSREQMEAINSYAKALGYQELYSDVKPVVNADKPGAWRFGTKADIPYQVDWTVVWGECTEQHRHQQSKCLMLHEQPRRLGQALRLPTPQYALCSCRWACTGLLLVSSQAHQGGGGQLLSSCSIHQLSILSLPAARDHDLGSAWHMLVYLCTTHLMWHIHLRVHLSSVP